MHKFDEKVIRLQKLVKNASKFFRNSVSKDMIAKKEYGKWICYFAINNLKKFIKKHGPQKAFLKICQIIITLQNKQPKSRCDTFVAIRSIQYVRYLYDFLIGIVGTRKYASYISKSLSSFVKSNLRLKIKKDIVVYCNEKSVQFLTYLISFRKYPSKKGTNSKKILAAKKNKNKSISKFLENDKRLAKSKSYQFYSNVLKQFAVLSDKLNISVSAKSHVNTLASVIAYKYIGLQLMTKLPVTN